MHMMIVEANLCLRQTSKHQCSAVIFLYHFSIFQKNIIIGACFSKEQFYGLFKISISRIISFNMTIEIIEVD